MKAMRFCAFGLAAALALVTVAAAQPPRRSLPPGVKELRDLPYVENGHERNRLDLYLPEKAPDKPGEELPVVVWVHGGAWKEGSKENCPAAGLTAKGYAVASINYRLTQHAVFPAQINDCKAAVRWLRTHAAKYHLDPDHIGAWGASAGGHLVAMLGTTGSVKELEGDGGNLDQSSRVQCVVDWFGPSDLTTMGAQADKPIAQLVGGPVQDNKEKVRKASPITYVSRDSAPFLIMHGDQDDVVPLEQSEILEKALKKAGVEVKLQVIKGNKHGGPGFSTPESRKLIEEFFDKHLKGKRETSGKSAAQPPSKPRVLVTISKETTYITSPLRKDGYPDYVAALNERCKQGVTPENNAAVLFWQAMGPRSIAPEMRTRYFQMLDMQQPPEHGNYLVSSDTYFQQLKDAKDSRLPKSVENGQDPIWDQFTEATKRPWSRQEVPAIAAWLDANEKPLALLVKATKRPRNFDPMLGKDSDHTMVIAVLLDAANESREPARESSAARTLRLKEGKIDEAWDDLLACHRWARLVGQGPTLVEALVAIAVDSVACSGDQALFQCDKLTASQIARMREDLAKLPPMPRMADKIDFGERYMYLDCVTTLPRDGLDSMSTLVNTVSGRERSTLESLLQSIARPSIDWDSILRSGNSWYDRLVVMCRKPNRTERLRALRKFETDVKALQRETKDPESFVLSLLAKWPGQLVSERIGNTLIGLLLPALIATTDAEDRATMQSEVTRLGFALAAYRADHRAYPEQLSELAPRYVAKVPTDIFANDGPLHYKRQGKGYLLYSVGRNGRDDNGRGRDDAKEGEDWDDISVRVP